MVFRGREDKEETETTIAWTNIEARRIPGVHISFYKFPFLSERGERERKRRKERKREEITQKRKDRRCTSSDESRTKTISQWRHHLFCDSLTHRLIGIRQTYPGLEPDTAAKPDLIPMASHLSPFQFHSWTWQFPLPDRRYLPPSPPVPFVCEIAIFSIVSRNARSAPIRFDGNSIAELLGSRKIGVVSSRVYRSSTFHVDWFKNRDDSIEISFDFHSILLFFSPKNIYHSLFLFEHLKITPWIIQKLSLFHHQEIPINIASMQNKQRREKDRWSLNVGRATFQNPISSRGGMRKEITHLINLLSLSVNANVSRYFANRRAYGAAERIFDTLPFESSH